jgi:NTP pyrophosphatase (non-canonical NTP hydrolase)
MDKFVLNKIINEQNKEILLIAQEECAEVTQAISKVFRFGIEGEHNGATNRERLEEEVGDLLCMIDLMIENEILDANVVHQATLNKRQKLAKWSNIK